MVSQFELVPDIRQRLMRCSVPDIKEIDCHGECRQDGEGGDFFEFLSGPGPIVRVYLGSPLAKCTGSAAMATTLQATVRAIRVAGDDTIASTLPQLNHLIRTSAPGEYYAALFAAKFDVSRRRVQYVNAGQACALIVRHNADCAIPLITDNPVLGLNDRNAFQQHTIPFHPGDTLIACTQGVLDLIERRCDESEQFVCDLVRNNDRACAIDLANCLLSDNDDSLECEHDRSVVVVRFLGPQITVCIEESGYAVDWCAAAH